MKKTQTVVAKALCAVLVSGILGNNLPIQIANAATIDAQTSQQQSNNESKVLYEDNTYKITEDNSMRTVLNKETSQTVTLTFTNSKKSEGTFVDVDGNTKDYSTDTKGNMYLDGELVVEATHSISKVDNNLKKMQSRSYTNSKYFTGSDGLTYYYVTTYKTNSKTQGEANSIAMGILGLMPYAGTAIFIVGVIQTCQELGKPIVYIKEDQYCVSNCQKYAYKTYYYKNSNYTGLVDSTTEYKQMW
jgi:hypothetical protein